MAEAMSVEVRKAASDHFMGEQRPLDLASLDVVPWRQDKPFDIALRSPRRYRGPSGLSVALLVRSPSPPRGAGLMRCLTSLFCRTH
jgi:hypothetical protein